MKSTLTFETPGGYIRYNEYSKNELNEIAHSDENGIDDFLIFDIACVLECSKIEFDSLIYIIDIERKFPYDGNYDGIFNIDMSPVIDIFCLNFMLSKSIIVHRKGIPLNLKDENILKKFVSDISAVQRSGFIDINSFCQLENSLPFLWTRNITSRQLYEEIATMVFKHVDYNKDND